MKLTAYVLIIIAGVVLAANPAAFAQKGQGDETGMARQGVQPEIEVISGELDRVETGPCENTTGRAVIGTHIFIKSEEDGEVYNIHLGAAHAVKSYVENLEAGQTIEAHGFRTEQMEDEHFVAKKFTANGISHQLRDENLRPTWAGERGRGAGRAGDRPRRGRW